MTSLLRRGSSALVGAWLGAVSLVVSCTPSRPTSEPVYAAVSRTSPLSFRYDLADGKGALSSEALRGRPSVIVFLTTYDLASQAQARFLTSVARRHGPRMSAAAIVLEPPENRPLILAFCDALRLDYPVALGGASLLRGEGPFGDVHAVPTTVVLDSESRLVWKHVGLAKDDEIEAALRGQ